MSEFKKGDPVRVTKGADKFFPVPYKNMVGKVTDIAGDGVFVTFENGERGAFLAAELELVK